MKAQIFILIVAVSILVSNVQGDLIWDSGDHVFSEGSEDFIYMYNDATAEITGGWISEFYMYDNTITDVSGGGIGALLCYDMSVLGIYSTSSISLLRPSNTSTVNIHGATVNNLIAIGSSNTHIYDCTLNILDAGDTSTVVLYTEDYDFDPDGGFLQCGLLTGVWLESGNTFNIELESKDAFNHIVFVPEPTTLAILAFGSMFVSRIC